MRSFNATISDIQKRVELTRNNFEAWKALLSMSLSRDGEKFRGSFISPARVGSHSKSEWSPIRPSIKDFAETESAKFITFQAAFGTEFMQSFDPAWSITNKQEGR